MNRLSRLHFPERRAIASLDADFSAWHQGRRWFTLWTLSHEGENRAEARALARQLAVLQTRCQDLLREDYARQPHVTLAVRGFSVPQGHRPDDFTPEALACDVAAVQALKLQPFAVESAAVDSFAMAPFVHLRDPQRGVAALHAALAGSRGPFAEGGARAYVPHWTIGLYRAHWPRSMVARRLRSLPRAPRLRLPVTGLSLLCYDAQELAGPLRRLGYYDLREQRFSAEAPGVSQYW